MIVPPSVEFNLWTLPRITYKTYPGTMLIFPSWLSHGVETKRFHMSNLLERITVNLRQCGGRPCIRGMRIRVTDVLDLFAAGLSAEQILEELPDLEMDYYRKGFYKP